MNDIDPLRLGAYRSQAAGQRRNRGRSTHRRHVMISLVLMLLWLLCLAAGLAGQRDKLVGISGMAWTAMVLGVVAAMAMPRAARWIAWADGMAAGAMVASACVFLLPMAMGAAPGSGALGVAGGLLIGSLLHAWARNRHLDGHAADASLVAITLHAVGAGIVIGLVYARMPSLGLLGPVNTSRVRRAGDRPNIFELCKTRRRARTAVILQ